MRRKSHFILAYWDSISHTFGDTLHQKTTNKNHSPPIESYENSQWLYYVREKICFWGVAGIFWRILPPSPLRIVTIWSSALKLICTRGKGPSASNTVTGVRELPHYRHWWDLLHESWDQTEDVGYSRNLRGGSSVGKSHPYQNRKLEDHPQFRAIYESYWTSFSR